MMRLETPWRRLLLALVVGAMMFSVHANEAEEVFWNSVAKRGNREEFRAYLDKYPNGRYSNEARRRIEGMDRATLGPDSQSRTQDEHEASLWRNASMYWESKAGIDLSSPTRSGPRPPSFDCAKAATRPERLICAYPALGDVDARLTQLYGLMRKEYNTEARDKLRARQLNWIKQRDRDLLGRCLPGGSLDVTCAVSLYEQRIYELMVNGE